MNRTEALAYLDSHIGWGMEPGLERITAFLALMGNPQETYPIIHVAGTNGKTSVARMATMLCVAHGLTTGTYTSPHLERFEERISINGFMATEEQMIQAVVDVKAFADIFERDSHLTYFELVTALAFSWFAAEAVNAAVIEVGMGGRLDATNAAQAEVAVVTSIGMDHADVLGDTLEQIATEKLGILAPEATLVVGPLPDGIAKLARRTAAERGAKIYEYGSDFGVEGASTGIGGWQVDITGIHGGYSDIDLPLQGRHQTVNLAVAVAAVEALTERELDPRAVQRGVSVVATPGRMERIDTGPTILVDGAHNPDGMRTLGAALAEEYPTTAWVLVLGVMKDKDLDQMLEPLKGRVREVIATAVESERAMDPALVAERATGLLGVPARAIPSPDLALVAAREGAGADGAVLVSGSLYLVGAIRSLALGSGRPDRNER